MSKLLVGLDIGGTKCAVITGRMDESGEIRDWTAFTKSGGLSALVYLKNPGDEVTFLKALEYFRDNGADGVSLINTLLGMRINMRTRKPLIANTTGGYSGPAVFPVALRCVYQVYNAVKIPIVGMGGVSTAEDVIEMMLAGATAVEVGAANLVEPFACRDIIDRLPEAMQKYGITNLEEIIGGAH